MILRLRGVALVPQLYSANLLLAFCTVPNAAMAAEVPKPSLTIVLEESALLAGQWIGLHAWVENPTEHPIADLQLRFAAPDFIELGELVHGASGAGPRCQGGAAVIPLGTVETNSALDPPRELCLHAKSAVEEQDVNLAFSLSYVVNGSPPQRGVVVVEKKLSIGLFGTDTVAGVSLRLLTYLIPGLLLLMILRLGGIAAVVSLPGTDAAAISVLVSVGMTWLAANRLATRNVSARLFLILCLTAIVLGLVGLALNALLAWRRRAQLIAPSDGPEQALAKALRQRRDELAPVTVVTRDGTHYAGALSAATRDGGTALLGWFELNPHDPELRTQLERLRAPDGLRRLVRFGIGHGALRDWIELRLARCDLRRLVDTAIAYNRPPAERDLIRQRTEQGTWTPTAEILKRFSSDQVEQVSQGPIEGLDVANPQIILS